MKPQKAVNSYVILKNGKVSMPQENAEVLWNRNVGLNTMNMGLLSPGACRDVVPGQFVMTRSGEGTAPLLRRPFSVHNIIVENGTIAGIELLYKVVGPVTEQMAALKKGESLNLVAPLGQGFRFPGTLSDVMIVGGGIGIAPLLYLCSWLIEKGVKPSGIQVLIGGRNKEEVLCVDRFTEMGVSVKVSTDDGSSGTKGRVTELMEKIIQEKKPQLVYTCGPHPMLHKVADICEKAEIPCQVSVETLMACGVCACLGCAVEKRDDDGSYMHVCKNGPVFDSKDLAWK